MKESWRDGLQPVVLAVRRAFNWKVFLIVFLMSTFGLLMVIPYSLSFLPQSIEGGVWLITAQMLGNAIIYGGLAAIGLLLANRIGLGLPFIEGLINKKPVSRMFLYNAILAALIGLVGGALIILLDSAVFSPQMAALLEDMATEQLANIHPPVWQGLMASFEGGITEEVLLRLFLLTLFAWLGSLISKKEDGRPTLGVLWIANIIAAVVFGLAHLPATIAMGIPATTIVVMRAIVLNGFLGMAFGWLYWRYGLESAMVSHFSADIMMHVIWVLLIPLFS